MKKKAGFLGILVIAIVLIALRFYRKYERQRIQDANKKYQMEQYERTKKILDSIKRVEQDSVMKAQYKNTRLDSMNKVNRQKLEEMKKLMEQLEKEK